MSRDAIAVIPARYGSTRFPGKPLAQIRGRPMIHWVIDGVVESDLIAETLVATDDERIVEVVEGTAATPVMTSESLESGSDRVAAVARDRDAPIVVNVQGDEPLVRGAMLDRGIRALREDDGAVLASFYAPCPPENVEDPDVAKVVLDRRDRALYFSRSPIPYRRGDRAAPFQHVGIYVFERSYLLAFQDQPPTPLEQTEKLEQLRVLENGESIRMVRLEAPTVGVDRPEDIEKVESALEDRIPPD